MDTVDRKLLISSHHTKLRETVETFAAETIAPAIPAMEETADVDAEVIREIARQGWIGVTIPQAYGGMGLDHKARVLLIDLISRVSGAMGAATQASILGVAKILHFGDDEQRKQWLPAIASGECLPTIATTEPGSGSNVLEMKASAVKVGSDWVLNGHKNYIGNSHVADLHGVVVRTGPGSRGLSAFLIPADTPGCHLGEHVPLNGLRGFSAGDVYFDNCRVPESALLGVEGDGLAVAFSSSILYGRANLAAVALGLQHAVLDDTAAETQRRQRYGGSLAELPTVRQQLAEIQSNVMTSRRLLYHAVDALDEGLACDEDLINAKLVTVQRALDSVRRAERTQAAEGQRVDRPLQRYSRDIPATEPPAGTSDVQLHRLAQLALGTMPAGWSTQLADKVARREIPV